MATNELEKNNAKLEKWHFMHVVIITMIKFTVISHCSGNMAIEFGFPGTYKKGFFSACKKHSMKIIRKNSRKSGKTPFSVNHAVILKKVISEKNVLPVQPDCFF